MSVTQARVEKWLHTYVGELVAIGWQGYRVDGPGIVYVFAQPVIVNGRSGVGYAVNYIPQDAIPTAGGFISPRKCEAYNPETEIMVVAAWPTGGDGGEVLHEVIAPTRSLADLHEEFKHRLQTRRWLFN